MELDYEQIVYQEQRDRLIIKAEHHANQTVGRSHKTHGQKRDEWAAEWNKCFHNKMDQLARSILKGGKKR